MTRERRLGRGLAALLGGSLDGPMGPDDAAQHADPAPPPTDARQTPGQHRPSSDQRRPTPEPEGDGEMILLGVYEIDDNPYQPRREFSESEIASLSESLKEHDMLQPVLVRRVAGRYQLISGDRRLRAAIRAGWSQVPARVRKADDRLVAELAIVENLQRKDLNAIEKALSFARYIREHQCTQEDLASRIKIDRSTIANLVRLLELPEPVKDAIGRGAITAGHARALLPLGDEPAQIEFARRIQEEGLSVRETERQVQEKIRAEDAEPLAVIGGDGPRPRKRQARSRHIASLEQRLRIALGTKVDIRQGSRGRGRIIIHFTGNDEFERIERYLTDPGAGEAHSDAG